MADKLMNTLTAWGPECRVARVRWAPSGSATQTLTEAVGVSGVARTGAGAYTISLVDTNVKDLECVVSVIENDTTIHHQTRVESFSASAGTIAVSHKASTFTNGTYTPTGTVYMTIPDVSVADTYYAVSGVAGTISSIRTVIDDAITNRDVTLTCNINGTPITSGVVTITQSGSAAGDRDSATPSAANTVAVGDYIGIVVNGNGASADLSQCEVAFVVTGAAATVVTSGLLAPVASDTVDQLQAVIFYRVYD